jgi:hypothetical protein
MPKQFTFTAAPIAMIAFTGAAHAATPGAIETFQSGLNGWGSNPALVSHVPTGGADGPADGYASVASTGETEINIRIRPNDSADFTGDFTAAGITQVSFAISELAIDDGLGIRLGFGSPGNFWVSNQSFEPQVNTWETVTIDLIESNFTEVFGAGGVFSAAMSNVQRFQIRHDIGPPSMMPDISMGEFGVDNITLLPTPGPVAVLALGGALAMTRRRAS